MRGSRISIMIFLMLCLSYSSFAWDLTPEQQAETERQNSAPQKACEASTGAYSQAKEDVQVYIEGSGIVGSASSDLLKSDDQSEGASNSSDGSSSDWDW
ncbi:MAG: hypothetical protein ABIG92_05265 [Candidatus Omnitrophota bacterium]